MRDGQELWLGLSRAAAERRCAELGLSARFTETRDPRPGRAIKPPLAPAGDLPPGGAVTAPLAAAGDLPPGGAVTPPLAAAGDLPSGEAENLLPRVLRARQTAGEAHLLLGWFAPDNLDE
ncbi:MAG: hypothetical protein LBK98_01190 [Peptococcaceae bacterium]|nr:hypothetical protein [Peptococcaceae bacterium]